MKRSISRFVRGLMGVWLVISGIAIIPLLIEGGRVVSAPASSPLFLTAFILSVLATGAILFATATIDRSKKTSHGKVSEGIQLPKID